MLIAGTRLPVWLTVVYIAALCAMLAWPCLAFITLFFFDDPAANRTPLPYLYAACALLYPLLPIGGVLGSFFAYRKARKRLAYALAILAVIPSVLIFLWIAFSILVLPIMAILEGVA